MGEIIAKVNPKTKTPQAATIFIWILSVAIILSFRRIEIITSVGAVAAYIGYSGIMLATILSPKGYLDKKRRWVRVIAFIWTIFVVVALSIPETNIPGISLKHLPAVSSLIAGIFGFFLYWVFLRKKILSGEAGSTAKF